MRIVSNASQSGDCKPFPLPWYSGGGLGWGLAPIAQVGYRTGSLLPAPHLVPPPGYEGRRQETSSRIFGHTRVGDSAIPRLLICNFQFPTLIFWLLAASSLLLMTGCAAPTNPSFPISINQGRTALKQMAADPRPLPRPLILIGGFLDPISTDWMEAELRAISHDRRIVTVCIAGHLSFWGYRRELLEKIAPFLPPDENGRRPEADVVGFSLGGLVARYSAIPENDGRAPCAYRGFSPSARPTADRPAPRHFLFSLICRENCVMNPLACGRSTTRRAIIRSFPTFGWVI